GRYLTTELPQRASRAEVERAEVERKLSELRRGHPGIRVVDEWFDSYRRHVTHFARRVGRRRDKEGNERQPTFFGALRTFFWVLWDDLSSGTRQGRLSRALRKAVRGHGAGRARKVATKLGMKMALYKRRQELLPHLVPLFRHWKAVHVPMAICLSI